MFGGDMDICLVTRFYGSRVCMQNVTKIDEWIFGHIENSLHSGHGIQIWGLAHYSTTTMYTKLTHCTTTVAVLFFLLIFSLNITRSMTLDDLERLYRPRVEISTQKSPYLGNGAR